ncbi:MAG: class I SAM-dependent methyltransferase [Candidatus Heimdallarchaeota archaeon]|nr:MAG: class I SAM-dependent methyltransferase [Candidatus Heimdallarchaeota archaeon]
MSKEEYYSTKLSALRLKRCYEIAPPRIQQYLEAEIKFILENIKSTDHVLELGCGYGRVLARLAEEAQFVSGIDTSEESLLYAQEYLTDFSNIKLHKMNAVSLDFEDQMFQVVIAIQNGISAFKVDPYKLIQESIRVTKTGGKVLFSSYSEKIWEKRLDWFIKQSEEGLIGEIDMEKSKNGIIVCKDGFIASTYTPEDFTRLSSELKLNSTVEEVDESSIFWVIQVNYNH